MNSENKFYLIAYTDSGIQLANRLCNILAPAEAKVMDKIALSESGGLHAFLADTFVADHTVLVFICATGIAVRSLAPFVKDKLKDPPVIVIDDHGNFAISLLSGHIGGANEITEDLTEKLNTLGYPTQAVVTTATDVRGLRGIESLLKRFHVNLEKNRSLIKKVNMAIANGETVGLYIDPILIHSVETTESYTVYDSINAFYMHTGPKLVFCARKPEKWLKHAAHDDVTFLVSRSIVLGTGTKKNTSFEDYCHELKKVLNQTGFYRQSIQMMVSIDLKSEEKCLHQAAQQLKANLQFFTAETLLVHESHFEGSEFVKKTTGVASVAGASAYHVTQDSLTFEVYKGKGSTFSFGRIKI